MIKNAKPKAKPQQGWSHIIEVKDSLLETAQRAALQFTMGEGMKYTKYISNLKLVARKEETGWKPTSKEI